MNIAQPWLTWGEAEDDNGCPEADIALNLVSEEQCPILDTHSTR